MTEIWRFMSLAALLLVSTCGTGFAQLPDAAFQRLGVDDGLPGTRTTVVSQGPNGLVWVGTASGLAVYDGYQLSLLSAAEHPLATASVSAIAHDGHGTSWVATQGSGLFRYHHADRSVTSVAVGELPDDILGLSAGDEALWIATAGAVFKLSYADGSLSAVPLPYTVQSVQAILAEGGSAAVASEQGLFFTHEPQRLYPFDTEHNPVVIDLHRSADGDLWAATRLGLFRFDQQRQAFVGFRRDSAAGSPQRSSLNAITQDPFGHYWFAGDRTGLCRFSEQGPIACYRHRSGEETSLSANGVRSLFIDRENNLWAATTAGVARLNLDSLQFGRYTDTPHDPSNCLQASGINAILAEPDAVWLGSNSGLVKWADRCTHYASDPDDATTLSAPEVYALWREDADHLWVATSAGLDLLNQATGEISRDAAKSLSGIPIFGFAESSAGDLLVSARTTIVRRPPGADTFTPIDVADEQLHAFIWKIEPTHTGEFWVGTSKGLGRMRTVAGPLELVRKPDGEPLFTQVIGAIHAQADGKVWVGVDKVGLFLLSPAGEVLHRYDQSSGLANLEFSAIVPDQNNQLWISTRRGIARLDKATQEVTAFRVEDGLQDEFFMQNAADTGPDGRLYFGGRNGINVFRPERIKAPSSVKPRLSRLLVDGEPVQPQSTRQDALLTRPLAQTESLEFSHRTESFSLEFLSISHTSPERTSYAYRLEGAHSNWNQVDAQNRRATYTSLQPGHYTFRYKAAAPHGDWVEGEPLHIRVLPPPWLTPFAFSLYALVLGMAGIAAFLLRTRALRRRTVLLEQRVAERTSTIEALLDRKNEELANLSHEFRTPLTLILGPIKSLLARVDSGDAQQKLQLVQRNSQRLLRMVDQLLQMERFKVQQALRPRPQRVQAIARQISKSFEELAAEQRIEVCADRIDDVWLALAPDAFEKILLNLLSNALKYTQPEGQVRLSLIADDNTVRLTVADTGIGIPEHKQAQVFERYQRALDEHSENIVGTGIGLALVKELVEAHGGQITLQSAPGKGSTFIVSLPLAKPEADELEETPLNLDLLELELATLGLASRNEQQGSDDVLGDPDSAVRLMVIEDNADMRAYIMESLAQGGGYHITSASNGREGVDAAREQVPDIIISDVMMPEMDGYEVVRALKADDRTSHIPIVLLTARGDRKSRLRGWNEKADEYLTKPFDEEELRLRVKNLLDMRKLLQTRFGQTHFPGPQQSTKTDDEALNPRDQAFLEKFKAMIEERYSDPEFKVVEMARLMAMSERPLQRKLKALLGHTPNEYLRTYRLEKAGELLRQGHTVAEAAFAVGFNSHSYFSGCFKAHFGSTPSDFVSS